MHLERAIELLNSIYLIGKEGGVGAARIRRDDDAELAAAIERFLAAGAHPFHWKDPAAREIVMLRYRYGLDDDQPRKMREVAARFGFTTQRAGFIIGRAMRRLRRPQYGAELWDRFIEITGC